MIDLAPPGRTRGLERADVGWLAEIAKAGHPAGNHTYDHVNATAAKVGDLQFRFQRAPWLLRGQTVDEAIREIIELCTKAMKRRLGSAPAGFRTPGGLADGLRAHPRTRAMLKDLGFDWASSLDPPHPAATAKRATEWTGTRRRMRSTASGRPRHRCPESKVRRLILRDLPHAIALSEKETASHARSRNSSSPPTNAGNSPRGPDVPRVPNDSPSASASSWPAPTSRATQVHSLPGVALLLAVHLQLIDELRDDDTGKRQRHGATDAVCTPGHERHLVFKILLLAHCRLL